MYTVCATVALYVAIVVTIYQLSKRRFQRIYEWGQECEEFCFAASLMGLVASVIVGLTISAEVTRRLPRITSTQVIALTALGADDVKPGAFVLHQIKPSGWNFYQVKLRGPDGVYRFEIISESGVVEVLETDGLKDQGALYVTCTRADLSGPLAFWADDDGEESGCKRKIMVPQGSVDTRLTTN